jgi:DNA-binding MarR family transcriptional regulator
MTWHRDDSHALDRDAQHGRKATASVSTSVPASGAAATAKLTKPAQTKLIHAPASMSAERRESESPCTSPALAHHNREHEGYLIKELQQLLRTQIEARIRAKGLWVSFPHSTVLMTLQAEPGLSGAQLARRNSVTAQTMNGLLLPLEAKGLIERSPDPENARVLRCYLKPKGIGVLQQGMLEAGAVFDLMLGKLSEHERHEFRNILRRCIEALQARGGEVASETAVIEKTGLAHAAKRQAGKERHPKAKKKSRR